MANPTGKNTGTKDHDHSACISHVRREIETRDPQPNLTPAREMVLDVLLSEHRAFGAYEILDALRASGQKAQPPVAYRALDYLMSQGLVHKIESLNAYVACTDPQDSHQPNFLICSECSTVEERHSTTRAKELRNEADSSGFAISSTVVEAVGTCAACLENK